MRKTVMSFKYKNAIENTTVLLMTILLSAFMCSFLLLLYHADLKEAYGAMFHGAFGSAYNISETLSRAAPLLLVALGFAIASKASMFNIGGEGQMYAGALGAAILALFMPENTPKLIAVILIMLAGFICGLIWVLPVAYLKTKFGISEVVMTVMLNEVAAGIVSWLVSGPIKDPAAPLHQSSMFPENWRLAQLFSGTKIHLGIPIAFALIFFVWFLIRRTTYGYRIAAVGLSEKAAAYAGIPVSAIMISAMLISGGFAGIAGAFEATGVHYRMIETVTGNYGYAAIVIAQLGKKNPIAIAFAAVAFAALTVGADAMQRTVGTPSVLSSLIQGVTVFFWIISGYVYKRIKKHADEKALILGEPSIAENLAKEE